MGWLWGPVPSVSKILILKMTFEIWTPGVLSHSLFTLSAFKRGNSLLKNASKRTRIAEMQGYTQKLAWDLIVCIFAWELFVYLLSNVEVHF